MSWVAACSAPVRANTRASTSCAVRGAAGSVWQSRSIGVSVAVYQVVRSRPPGRGDVERLAGHLRVTSTWALSVVMPWTRCALSDRSSWRRITRQVSPMCTQAAAPTRQGAGVGPGDHPVPDTDQVSHPAGRPRLPGPGRCPRGPRGPGLLPARAPRAGGRPLQGSSGDAAARVGLAHGDLSHDVLPWAGMTSRRMVRSSCSPRGCCGTMKVVAVGDRRHVRCQRLAGGR